jgi:tRNA threonylcarbamoyladenosine biosynthesis protein TsaB
MKILAIESCTVGCSVALLIEGKKYSAVSDSPKSSSFLLGMCEDVFNQANIKLKDIDIIAYTKGPGTFTGVRMCTACVQGLALASDAKNIGISTLELMSYMAKKEFNTDKVAVAIDARMGEVYWSHDGNEQLLKPDCVPELNDKLSGAFIGVGSGWLEYEAVLSQTTKIKNYQDYQLKAEKLIDLVLEQYLDKLNTAVENIQPIYLRNDVAKKTKDRK